MKAPELPDKIYVREYQDGDYTTWWDEKPHEEESIGMKAVCYIRKDALLEWAENEKQWRVECDYDGIRYTSAISVLKDLIDKINSL